MLSYNIASTEKEAGVVNTALQAVPQALAGGALGLGVGHFMPGANAKYVFGTLGAGLGAASVFEKQREKDRIKRMYRDNGVYVSDNDADRMLSNSFAMPNHPDSVHLGSGTGGPPVQQEY